MTAYHMPLYSTTPTAIATLMDSSICFISVNIISNNFHFICSCFIYIHITLDEISVLCQVFIITFFYITVNRVFDALNITCRIKSSPSIISPLSFFNLISGFFVSLISETYLYDSSFPYKRKKNGNSSLLSVYSL